MSAQANATTSSRFDPIATFLPGCGEGERQARERLLRARDYASAAIQRGLPRDAQELHWMIVELATRWAFAAASVERLTEVRNQCLRLAMCADFFEREAADGD